MLKIALKGTTSNLHDKRVLKVVKLTVPCNGAWYRALRRIDRVLSDFTMKVTEIVRNATLAKSILTIIKKLEENIGGGLSRAVRDFVFSLAPKLSSIAQRWDNPSSKEWVFDLSLLRFPVIFHINDPLYSKTNKSYPRNYPV